MIKKITDSGLVSLEGETTVEIGVSVVTISLIITLWTVVLFK